MVIISSNSFNKEVEKHKPQGGRIDVFAERSIFKREGGDVPVANNKGNHIVKSPWDWPGFGHDAPAPRPKTLSDIFGNLTRKAFPGRGRRGTMKPSRKNI